MWHVMHPETEDQELCDDFFSDTFGLVLGGGLSLMPDFQEVKYTLHSTTLNIPVKWGEFLLISSLIDYLFVPCVLVYPRFCQVRLPTRAGQGGKLQQV